MFLCANSQVLDVDLCELSVTGDTYFELLFSNGTRLGISDDDCGQKSKWVGNVPLTDTYTLKASCYPGQTCSGDLDYLVIGSPSCISPPSPPPSPPSPYPPTPPASNAATCTVTKCDKFPSLCGSYQLASGALACGSQIIAGSLPPAYWNAATQRVAVQLGNNGLNTFGLRPDDLVFYDCPSYPFTCNATSCTAVAVGKDIFFYNYLQSSQTTSSEMNDADLQFVTSKLTGVPIVGNLTAVCTAQPPSPYPPSPRPPAPVQQRTRTTCGAFGAGSPLNCTLQLCAGQTVLVSQCADTGIGNTALSLYDGSGTALLAADDDSCGVGAGAELMYTALTTANYI